ncbi:Uncharacterised protein [Mycobacteroides abscessus subsp. abscessus]|nr:Uncharacterised protein [Mycobacteroides abscessus subsp. abscessus]
MGVDAAVRVPVEIARRKSVLLLTPTTALSSPSTLARQTNADTLATLSTTEQYTPPCTIPWGCRRFSVMARLAVTPSGVSEVYSSPTSLSKGAVGILLNCSGVSDI